jgi:hypothetical protein
MGRLPLLDNQPAKNIPEIPVADIEVGARHRHDMGNINELAQNIAELGLLHPIVVTPPRDGRWQLIAGARRLLAYPQAGSRAYPGNGSRSRSNRPRRIRRELLPQGVYAIRIR